MPEPEELPQLAACRRRRPRVDFEVPQETVDVAHFAEHGFAQLERLTSDEELEWLRELYDVLFAFRVEAVPGGHFDLSRPYESEGPDLLPQILAPESRVPELRDTAAFRNGRKVAALLLGADEAQLRGWGHMIRKPPRIGSELPWHQDEAYWDPAFEYRALGAWLTLDPATRESGCMRFVPGSQREGVRPHRHLGDDPNVHGLVTDAVDESRAVEVPAPAGGAIFHHCRVLHASLPNVTEVVRRAWANEFQVKPRPITTPESRPWIAAGQRAWAARTARPEAS